MRCFVCFLHIFTNAPEWKKLYCQCLAMCLLISYVINVYPKYVLSPVPTCAVLLFLDIKISWYHNYIQATLEENVTHAQYISEQKSCLILIWYESFASLCQTNRPGSLLCLNTTSFIPSTLKSGFAKRFSQKLKKTLKKYMYTKAKLLIAEHVFWK